MFCRDAGSAVAPGAGDPAGAPGQEERVSLQRTRRPGESTQAPGVRNSTGGAAMWGWGGGGWGGGRGGPTLSRGPAGVVRFAHIPPAVTARSSKPGRPRRRRPLRGGPRTFRETFHVAGGESGCAATCRTEDRGRGQGDAECRFRRPARLPGRRDRRGMRRSRVSKSARKALAPLAARVTEDGAGTDCGSQGGGSREGVPRAGSHVCDPPPSPAHGSHRGTQLGVVGGGGWGEQALGGGVDSDIAVAVFWDTRLLPS